MSKINVKITSVLLIYALLITGIFVWGILSFTNFSSNDQVNIYLESNNMEVDESVLSSDNSKEIALKEQRLEDLQNYANYYHQQLMHQIMITASFFGVFLIGSSFILWLVLKRIQKKENIKIAKQLNSIQEMKDFVSDDPILAKAFENIRSEFERHIMDYKRLHTYLSHEQKNSLSLLRANLELHHEDACLKNIDDLSMGIDDLVTLSENKATAVVQPIDIVMECAEVVDNYIPHYPLLRYEFDEEALFVQAKARWITCALNNLIDNAIKYGANKEIIVTVKGEDNYVLLQVEDHGIGIVQERQKIIFEQNYRINELNKDGYGIGLSLISHVCHLCHGEIICQSKLGEGSIFTMKLPRCNLSKHHC